MEPSQYNLAKLPQWAQQYIRILEMRLAEAQERNDALLGKYPTNVFWQSVDGNKPLPHGASVRFVLDADMSSPNGQAANHIDARVERGKLYINAGACLDIRPESANSVRLTTKTPLGTKPAAIRTSLISSGETNKIFFVGGENEKETP